MHDAVDSVRDAAVIQAGERGPNFSGDPNYWTPTPRFGLQAPSGEATPFADRTARGIQRAKAVPFSLTRL